MKRLIQQRIGDKLALALLECQFNEGDSVVVDVEGDRDETVLRGPSTIADGVLGSVQQAS